MKFVSKKEGLIVCYTVTMLKLYILTIREALVSVIIIVENYLMLPLMANFAILLVADQFILLHTCQAQNFQNVWQNTQYFFLHKACFVTDLIFFHLLIFPLRYRCLSKVTEKKSIALCVLQDVQNTITEAPSEVSLGTHSISQNPTFCCSRGRISNRACVVLAALQRNLTRSKKSQKEASAFLWANDSNSTFLSAK